MLEESFGVKERRACRVVGQNRSTQRLAVPLPSDDEQELRRWLVKFSKDNPRWGWHAADALGVDLPRPPQYDRARKALWPGEALKHG